MRLRVSGGEKGSFGGALSPRPICLAEPPWDQYSRTRCRNHPANNVGYLDRSCNCWASDSYYSRSLWTRAQRPPNPSATACFSFFFSFSLEKRYPAHDLTETWKFQALRRQSEMKTSDDGLRAGESKHSDRNGLGQRRGIQSPSGKLDIVGTR